MKRILILLYGIVSYVTGLGGLTAFILYLGGWGLVPFRVQDPPTTESLPVTDAVMVNLALMLLFGVQHSVMARSGFKRLWTRVIPEPIERSTYVLLSGVLMLMFCWFWQPLPGTVWQVTSEPWRSMLTGVCVLGWVIGVLATFLINHAELFGLQQVYCHFVRQPVPDPVFSERLLYRLVRHPLQFGVFVGIWATPHMTTTQLMLSATMTLYILIGLACEERALLASLGDDYRDYRRRVPMLLPLRFGRSVKESPD